MNARKIIIAFMSLCFVSSALAQQRYLVRISADAASSTLSDVMSMPALSQQLLRFKNADNVQSDAERRMFQRLSQYHVVTVDAGHSIDVLLRREGVELVQPLGRFQLHEEALTDDSLSSSQYALHRVQASRAWKQATGRGVVVGIIDTGIDWNHEDLVNALDVNSDEDRNGNGRFDPWPATDTLGGVQGDLDGVDNDANGVIDDVIGIDVVDQTNRNLGDDRVIDPVPFDEQGHGTLVAGVIAATPNNKKGIAGLAYDARLRIVRAFDATGNAEEDDIATAVVYLAQQRVDIINMSFGDGADSPLLQDAIRYAAARGCILVASVGNSGVVSRQYPAGYDNVIAVGATNDANRRAPFSSTGALVALSAPGQSIITTAVDSRYRSVSGTSFAAPYVAAACALMRERFPSIEPAEVRSTLQQRSLDLGEVGWDELYGAGLVQADRACSDGPLSRVEVTSPLNEEEVDAAVSPSIDVYGSTTLASFRGYEIAVGEGLSPRSWTSLVESSTSIRNGLLGRITLPSGDSSVVTLRLRVLSSDGRSLDVMKRLRRVDTGALHIQSLEVVPAWSKDRRTHIVTVALSQLCSCEIATADQLSSPMLAYSPRRSRRHSMVLPDSLIGMDLRRLVLRCRGRIGGMIDTLLAVNGVRQGAGAESQWRFVDEAPWAGYVLPDVRDLYRDGKPTVVMSDLTRGTFGALVTRQYEGGRWITRDSLNEVYIPRGLGDVNGNGRTDLLVHTVGKVVLFEQQRTDASPFGSVIFADTTRELNGAGLADIDADGAEEILALSDNTCAVFKSDGPAFKLIGTITNPTPPHRGSASNRVDEISVAAADFDGDGRIEVAFADTDGDLVVGEWNGSEFSVTSTFLSSGVGGSGYVAAGDVTGDGRADILLGVPDSTDPDANGEVGRSAWTYTLLTANENDQFSVAWQDRVAGVRYGIGYRNGVAIAELDDIPGAEIVVVAFPRLFIFGKSMSADTGLVCKRYIEDVSSPRVLVYDFDGNGRPELGYGSTVDEIGAMTSFMFTEALPTVVPRAPASLRGRWVDSSFILDWMWKAEDDVQFVIEGASPGSGYQIIDTIDRRQYVIADTQFVSSSMRYRVRCLDGRTGALSAPSNAVIMFKPSAVVRLALDRDSIRRWTVQDGLQVRVLSSDDLLPTSLPSASCRAVFPENGASIQASSAVLRTSREFLLTFPPMNVDDSVIVSISGIRSATGKQIPDTALVMYVQSDPKVIPEIIVASLDVLSSTSLLVSFDQAVDSTANQPECYLLRPTGRVAEVEFVNDRTRRLRLSQDQQLEARGVPYALTVRGVTSSAGSRITTGPGSTILFSVVGMQLADVFAYPQPLRLTQHSSLVIAGLPAAAEVEVLDASFVSLATIATTAAIGGVEWDLQLSDGRTLVPGLYYLRVRDTGGSQPGEPILRKIWVER